MVIKESKIPIYKHRLTVILSSRPKKVSDYLLSKGQGIDPDEWDELYAHTFYGFREEKKGKYGCSYVVLNSKNKLGKLTRGVIAHEALHVVQNIFKVIGAEMDNDNPEPTNYLLEYVTDMITKFCKKHKVKVK